MEEIENVVESTESDASESPSSEDSNSSSESGEAAKAAAPKQEIDWSQAFEHPRFKELVDQKNEALKRYQEMESQNKAFKEELQSFKASQPKAPTETDALLKDLEKVDPRLANVIRGQLEAAETAKAVKAQLDQFQRQSRESALQQTIGTAVSKINSLHEINKVSGFGQKAINNALDLAYRGGTLNASDLKAVEGAYSEALKEYKTFEDSFKRDVTKGYVQDKTKDAKVPTSLPKGAQAKSPAKPMPSFKSKEELRQAVVRESMKSLAAAKEAANT